MIMHDQECKSRTKCRATSYCLISQNGSISHYFFEIFAGDPFY